MEATKIEEDSSRKYSGPLSVANWNAYNNGEKLGCISEFPLYTDTRIIGEARDDYGPYNFLNTIPSKERAGVLRPNIILRAEIFLQQDYSNMDKTDISDYHGGMFYDEIAALVSLLLGIRAKSGDSSRYFYPNGDPYGRPEAPKFRNEPVMIIENEQLNVPNAVGQHSLQDLTPIKLIQTLNEKEAIAVIRAARLYQDALWICESDPSLSWLMFVSALEVAANHWCEHNESPATRLNKSKPELYKKLQEVGGDELSDYVANEIIHTLGATNKFIKFVIEYLPGPPKKRPPVYAQIKWSKTFFNKALGKIYDYRSNALHGGIPFPAPMCRGKSTADKHMPEKPTGLASSSYGATWLAKDTPMNLHMFEYIARKVLINWIEGLGNKSTL